MARGPRLTIREVAEAAGVSIQTVSRVLNDRPDVAPETMERVRRVISETGYAPNMLARGLTQGRSHSLGVVAFGLEYFGPSRILTGIEQQAAELGYSISLNLIHSPETDTVEDVLNGLLSRRADGIIWAVPEVGHNRTWLDSRTREFPVPVVVVGGMTDQASLPCIGIDNHAIGALAARHLLEGGSRRPGIITGPMSWWESQQRKAGWAMTLASCGFAPEDALVVEGDWSPGSGEEAFCRLLEQSPDIDSVFASNDQMAIGVLHAAHRLGKRIPEDLAVVGTDDIAESSHLWPSLTTVHQPLRDAGALAVREVEQAIKRDRQRRNQEPPSPQTTLLEPELIVRESSRPRSAG